MIIKKILSLINAVKIEAVNYLTKTATGAVRNISFHITTINTA